MHWIRSVHRKLATRSGLLLFLGGLILLWMVGYYTIGFLSSDEWTRYTRQLYFSRATLVLAVGFTFWTSIPLLHDFIRTSTKTAVDLSIFRIVFFGFFVVGFFLAPTTLSRQLLPFLELPESAQVSLPFMSWYPKVIPINENLVRIALILFYCSIFTSFLGIKTRWSIVLFTLTAFYLFVIPNLYGKVNHNHELLWFPAILAFSPCADRYSIDAYIQKRQNRIIQHSTKAYTLPFVLIWMLMGIIYFFPGFWKIWSNGLDWFLTDNVRNQLYYKWFALGDWLPFFRIDHYPLLYKLSGLYTVIFELFFIPLLFNKKTRVIAIFMGIGFHVGTWVFMNIFFIVVVLSYASFINWHRFSWFKDVKSSTETTKGNPLVQWIGIGLIAFNILFGFGKWNSWPFTVYPTFDAIVAEETSHLVFVGETDSGKRIDLPVQVLHDEYTSPRYGHLAHNLIQSEVENKLDTVLLDQFLTVFAKEFDQFKTIDVYIELRSIRPENKTALSRSFVYSKNFPF